jgi:hypothetical protein
MCQFVALLREKWRPGAEVKTKLRLVGGTAVKKTTVERQESWTGARPLEKYSKTIKAATRRA